MAEEPSTILAGDLTPGPYASYSNKHMDFFLHSIDVRGSYVDLDYTYNGTRAQQTTRVYSPWYLTPLLPYVINELGVLA